ncbi:DUF2252 domain-containing protein [Nocardioides sp.]|uniref:DUF2252 domain-containing protein n=1 Tax=Nocardioides sp. TaxID=35761 RepID=UPI003519A1FB
MSVIHTPLASRWAVADDARAEGRARRDAVPHAAQAGWRAGQRGFTLQEFLTARAEGRLESLVPLGHGRMAASPFAFYRGTAGLMAADLATAPSTGLLTQLCGDAHAANFGLYGGHDGRIVMDLNDFDETVAGPWEWDLKRLAASLVLAAGVGQQVSAKSARKAARDAARSYRRTIAHLAGLPFLESWAALSDESVFDHADADALDDDFAAAAAKAAGNTSEKVAAKITSRDTADWFFHHRPPVLSSVEPEVEAAVLAGLEGYVDTLPASSRVLLSRYRPHDVAMRVVGTGSVGMRAYVVLLQGNGDEALILQVKQAGPSALAPFLPPVPVAHEGERIVLGARVVQSVSDHLLGWATVGDTPYLVRQFRNRKGSIDATLLGKSDLDDYGRLAGALLARAHARTLDPRQLEGYLSVGLDKEEAKGFDDAVATFAVDYAAQVEADFAEFRGLLDDGVLPVEYEED